MKRSQEMHKRDINNPNGALADLSDDSIYLSNSEKRHLGNLIKDMSEYESMKNQMKTELIEPRNIGKITDRNKDRLGNIKRFIKEYGLREDVLILEGDKILLNVKNAYDFFRLMSTEHKEMFVDMLGENSEILAMIYLYAKTNNEDLGKEYNDISYGGNKFENIKEIKDWLFFRGYQMDYGIQKYIDTINITTPEGKASFEMINTPYELKKFIEKFAALEKALKTKDENKIRESLVDLRMRFFVEFSNGKSELGKNLFGNVSRFLFENYDSGIQASKTEEMIKAVDMVVLNRKKEFDEKKGDLLESFLKNMKSEKILKFFKDIGYDDRILNLFDLPEVRDLIKKIIVESSLNSQGKPADFLKDFFRVLKSKYPRFREILYNNPEFQEKTGKSEHDFLASIEHIFHSILDPENFGQYTKEFLEKTDDTKKTEEKTKNDANHSTRLVMHSNIAGDVAAHVLYRGPEVGFDSTKLSFDLIFRKKIEQFGFGLTWDQKKILYSMKVYDERSLQDAIRYVSGYLDDKNKYWVNYYSNTQWIKQEAQEAKQEVEKVENNPQAQEIIQEHKQESQKIDAQHKENSQQIQSMTKDTYAKIYHEAVTKYSDPERYAVWQSSQGNVKDKASSKSVSDETKSVSQTAGYAQYNAEYGYVYVPNHLTYSGGNTMENPFFDGQNPSEKILKGESLFDLNKKLLVELLKKNGFDKIKGFEGTIDDMTKSIGINISEHLRPDDLDRFIKVFAKFMVESIDANVKKVSDDKKVLLERAKKEIIKDHKKGVLILFEMLNDNPDILMALDIYDISRPGDRLFRKLVRGYGKDVDLFFDRLKENTNSKG